MVNTVGVYKKDRQCAKCGEVGATSAYRDGSRGLSRFPDDKARIGRRCQNCGYEWFEWPLDYDPSAA